MTMSREGEHERSGDGRVGREPAIDPHDLRSTRRPGGALVSVMLLLLVPLACGPRSVGGDGTMDDTGVDTGGGDLGAVLDGSSDASFDSGSSETLDAYSDARADAGPTDSTNESGFDGTADVSDAVDTIDAPSIDSPVPDVGLDVPRDVAADVATDVSTDTPSTDVAPDSFMDSPDVVDAPVVSDVPTDTGGAVTVRLVSPVAGMRVGVRPALRWLLPAGADGARIEFCVQRTCAVVERTVDVVGSTTVLATALPAGLHYWRVRPMIAGVPTRGPTAPWHFVVSIATRVASAGDFNGDGRGDLVAAFRHADVMRAGVSIYSGLSQTPIAFLDSENSSSMAPSAVAYAGDVNGDGFDDLLTRHSTLPSWFAGGALGPGDPGTMLSTGRSAVAGAGDLNGDGFDDLLTSDDTSSVAGMSSAGRVYYYPGGASGPPFIPTVTLVAPVPMAGGRFGLFVASVGDTDRDGFADVVIGTAIGPAYLFRGSASGPSGSPPIALTVPGGGPPLTDGARAGDVNGDGFDDVILCAGDSSGSAGGTGRVHFYPGASAGIAGSPTASWAGVGAFWGGHCAGSTDVNGDGLADIAVSSLASVSVFDGSAGGPVTSGAAVLTIPGGRFAAAAVTGLADIDGDGFGDLAVGQPEAAVSGLSSSGAVYVFRGAASGVSTSSTEIDFNGGEVNLGTVLSNLGDINRDGLGDFVALLYATNRTLVRYGVRGSASGIADLILPYAASSAVIADVNGDGFGDVVLGVADAFSGEGQLVWFRGSAAGISATGTSVFAPDPGGFGSAMCAMDVNRDGIQDIVVGAYRALTVGRVYAFAGNMTGLASSPALSLTNPATTGRFGQTMQCGIDLDRDSNPDLVIGSPGFTSLGSSVGQILVYRGTATSLAPTAAVIIVGPGAPDGPMSGFSESLLGVRDLDHDGYDDLVVGALNARVGGVNTGRAYLYRGGSDVLNAARVQAIDGSLELGANFGNSLASTGDLDGDGWFELAISGPRGTTGAFIRVFEANAAGLATTPVSTLVNATATAIGRGDLGAGLAGGMDVDGDGFSDLLAGSPVLSRVFVFRGRSAGYASNTYGAVYSPPRMGTLFGNALAR